MCDPASSCRAQQLLEVQEKYVHSSRHRSPRSNVSRHSRQGEAAGTDQQAGVQRKGWAEYCAILEERGEGVLLYSSSGFNLSSRVSRKQRALVSWAGWLRDRMEWFGPCAQGYVHYTVGTREQQYSLFQTPGWVTTMPLVKWGFPDKVPGRPHCWSIARECVFQADCQEHAAIWLCSPLCGCQRAALLDMQAASMSLSGT